MSVATISRTIDARDLAGIRPLMSLVEAIHEADVGAFVEVELHPLDRRSLADVAAWIHKCDHELVDVEVVPEDGRVDVVVRKTH
jgi:TusA-related sulfurtransferase